MRLQPGNTVQPKAVLFVPCPKTVLTGRNGTRGEVAMKTEPKACFGLRVIGRLNPWLAPVLRSAGKAQAASSSAFFSFFIALFSNWRMRSAETL